METASFFIKDKALFGGYPTQLVVNELEDNGVRIFVNLTCDGEKNIVPFNISSISKLINYPIIDHSVPNDVLTFSGFIVYISKIIKELSNNDRLYLFCKGGHNRSSLVVSSIICYLYEISVYDSIIYTSKCHSARSVLRQKWRNIKVPTSSLQKKFIHQLFKPIHLQRMYKGSYMFNAIGEFYSKDLEIMLYSLSEGLEKFRKIFESDIETFKLLFTEFTGIVWDKEIEEICISRLIQDKIEQNIEFRNGLIRTNLRSILNYNFHDLISTLIIKILKRKRSELLLLLVDYN